MGTRTTIMGRVGMITRMRTEAGDRVQRIERAKQKARLVAAFGVCGEK
jgi:ribosomal protein L34